MAWSLRIPPTHIPLLPSECSPCWTNQLTLNITLCTPHSQVSGPWNEPSHLWPILEKYYLKYCSGWTSLPTDKQLCPQIPKVLTVTFIRHVEVFPCPPHHSLQDRTTLMCLRGASSSTFSGCPPPGLLSDGLGAHSEPGSGGSPEAHHPSLGHPGRLSGAEPLS